MQQQQMQQMQPHGQQHIGFQGMQQQMQQPQQQVGFQGAQENLQLQVNAGEVE